MDNDRVERESIEDDGGDAEVAVTQRESEETAEADLIDGEIGQP